MFDLRGDFIAVASLSRIAIWHISSGKLVYHFKIPIDYHFLISVTGDSRRRIVLSESFVGVGTENGSYVIFELFNNNQTVQTVGKLRDLEIDIHGFTCS